MERTGVLQELQKKYGERGFRVVCLLEGTDEELRKVLPPDKGDVWVGSGWTSTLMRYVTEGKMEMPHYYLVDDEGTVVGQELPEAAQVERHLEGVFVRELGRDLAPELAEARAAYEADRPGAAWRATEPLLRASDAKVAEDAAFLRSKLERWAAWQKGKLEKQVSKAEPPAAMAELLRCELRFQPMELATWAGGRATELEKTPAIQADRFAWKKLRAALAKEAKASGSKSALQSAVSAYRAVVRDHADSPAAAFAKERLATLGG